MNKIEPRILKGFRDYGFKEQLARQAMFQKIQTVFERFGFLPMSTPVIEYKEVLMGKIGEDEKLIYSFQDHGGRDVALRYDLTVSLARYAAHNQNVLTFPFKRYQIAPVWRAENTQKGRLREFYQCDIDVVGTKSAVADAEVIACLCEVLDVLGIKEYEVQINDRRIFKIFEGAHTMDVIRAIDKLDKVGKDGVLDELAKKKIDPELIKKTEWFIDAATSDPEKIGDELEQRGFIEVWNSVRALQSDLKNLGVDLIKIKFNPTIARGLDYYTSTVFETVLKNNREFGSIASGGRYDNLVDTFSEKSLSAVGGSIGIDRLFEALESMNLITTASVVQVLIINQDETLKNDYLRLVSGLRNIGISGELYYEPTKLDKQFKYAESKGIPYAVIMGKDEKDRGVVKVKNLQTREQEEVGRDNIANYLGSVK